MALPTIIRPSVHRMYELTGGPLTITIPAGEIWEFLSWKTTYVTAGENFQVHVDGRLMIWGCSEVVYTMFGRSQEEEDYRAFKEHVEIGERMETLKAMPGQVVTISSSDNSGGCWFWYRVHTLDSGIKITSDGATNSRKRVYYTWGRQEITIAATTVAEYLMNVSANPPGIHDFPWGINAPAQRKFELLKFIFLMSDTPSGQVYLVNIRILHEGREIVREAGIPTIMATLTDAQHPNRAIIFPRPAYYVDEYENLQVLMTWGNGPAQEETFIMQAGFIMNEVEEEEVMP